MKNHALGFHAPIAEEIAELSIADNLQVGDAVNEYLKLHPCAGAEYHAEELRQQVYDLLIDYSLED